MQSFRGSKDIARASTNWTESQVMRSTVTHDRTDWGLVVVVMVSLFLACPPKTWRADLPTCSLGRSDISPDLTVIATCCDHGMRPATLGLDIRCQLPVLKKPVE